jgi:hypothetical protein
MSEHVWQVAEVKAKTSHGASGRAKSALSIWEGTSPVP